MDRLSVPSLAAVPLLLLALATSFPVHASLDASGTRYDCPSTLDTLTPLGGFPAGPDGDVLVHLPPAAPGRLCTLSRLSSNGRYYIPVGRSYDGNDWESAAGVHSSIAFDNCGVEPGGSDRVCQASIPAQYAYDLTSYAYNPSDRDQVARFLEAASFGPTTELLDNWDYGQANLVDSMADWVQDQIDNAGTTSHREYYRKRLNPRSIETYKYGLSGPNACSAEARYRKFAFTQKDAYLSSASDFDWPVPGHNVTIETVVNGADTGYVLKYAGEVRTVLTSPLAWKSDNAVTLDDGLYKLCKVDEIEGSARAYPDRFQLKPANGTWPDGSDGCEEIEGGNPSVNLDERFVTVADLNYIDLSGLSSGTLVTNDIIVLNSENTHGGDMMLRADVSDAACANFPDPYDNDFRSRGHPDSPHYEENKPNWGDETLPGNYENTASRFNPDPPVFAKLPDNSYALHDTRALFLHNTVDSPASDGGGSNVLATIQKDISATGTIMAVDHDDMPRSPSRTSGEEQAVFCSNEGPTIFNEDGCVLSYDENACVQSSSSEDVDIAIAFDHTFLSRMYDLTGRFIYAPDGLVFDETNALDRLPCEHGVRSRWQIVDVGQCTAGALAAVHVETRGAFESLLYHSVDDNPNFRDVVMYEESHYDGQKCHADDVNATDFFVLVAEENRCFMNIHPDEWNIYDMSAWAGNNDTDTNHPGGFHNISQFTGTGFLLWPEVHTMDVWENTKSQLDYLGRLGDVKELHSFIKDLRIFQENGGTCCTPAPTSAPSEVPTDFPSTIPSAGPSRVESDVPSVVPSSMPSELPSVSSQPSSQPSDVPSTQPSEMPSDVPSVSAAPSVIASDVPSDIPSNQPSSAPSDEPSVSQVPSNQPSSAPSDVPSVSQVPSDSPSNVASEVPSSTPSDVPSVSAQPSFIDSAQPSFINSTQPSDFPSQVPSISGVPSSTPSLAPSVSAAPSDIPSMPPTTISHVARAITDEVLEDIANELGFIKLENQMKSSRGGTLVCGSIGEIAPDPLEDDWFEIKNRRLDSGISYGDTLKTVWTKIALWGPDQLRQRVAFALSQIFAISPSSQPGGTGWGEGHMYYYDIFVRNAFDNYRDVLKEVAFSIKMGQQLTFVGSKSVRTDFDRKGRVRFPDENFAREVMQLHTIGLVDLNIDGTPKRDRWGEKISTYDTRDILTFSRAWTGFAKNAWRGNHENGKDSISNDALDPMSLSSIENHDWFPKLDLYDGWIGDRYPLCYDLPSRAFLRKHATYKLLGGTSSGRYQYEKSSWDGNEKAKRFVLKRGDSELYDELCASQSSTSGGTDCTWPNSVTLSSDLNCYGVECRVDNIRVVQVAPGVFYEYIRRPCVQLAFFEGGKKIFGGSGNQYNMCAHPSMPVATESCCGLNPSEPNKVNVGCEYLGEMVTYGTNEDRCSAIPGASVCDATGVDECGECCGQVGVDKKSPKDNFFHWTSASCTMQVKVRIDGLAAIVHNPERNTTVIPYVNADRQINYLSFPWPKDQFTGDEIFPTMDDNCGNGTCALLQDWTCLCNTTTVENTVFSDMPSRDQVLDRLKVGAFEHDYVDNGEYTLVATVDGVSAYSRNGYGDYTMETIFSVENEYRETIYLKNVESTVEIGTDYADDEKFQAIYPLRIRNPAHFIDLVDPELRDAHYELDAVMDHLMRHGNTAPFISKQLIQHFGNSNPSPRYVEEVALAFQNGQYQFSHGGSGTITFGDQVWGNLAATVAAIVLDREATTALLDADPTYGYIREPLLKVMSYMKAMEYTPTEQDKNIFPKLVDMNFKIGQMVHEAPDQFSFFPPDYSPPGQLAQSSLVAPAGFVLDMYRTVSTIEGFFSFARQGLSSVDGGFGPNIWGSVNKKSDGSAVVAGSTDKSVGFLDFTPSSSTPSVIIDELATLLTSGRLSADSRQIILDAYNAEVTARNADAALRLAQQLITTTPEFHSNNLARKTGNKRVVTTPKEPEPVPYKAIVVLALNGGLDSFNVLTPHTTCPLYQSYAKERDDVKLLSDEMYEIDASDSDQPCTSFGVHHRIPVFRDLYNSGEGIFFANTGHLSKPVTKRNYFTETMTQLFSHNTMTQESYIVDAFQINEPTGILGRMLDVLAAKNMTVSPIGISTYSTILDGDPQTGRKVDVIPTYGPNVLGRRSFDNNHQNDIGAVQEQLEDLNGETEANSGIHANYWCQNFIDTWNKTEELSDLFASASLNTDFPGGLAKNFETISKLIKTHEERRINREAFFVNMGGFDAHAYAKENLEGKLPSVNSAIRTFYNEMVDQGMINNITFVVTSEFGRTITGNSGGGTDHAWGGNYFLFGGGVKGGKILGEYPKSFDDSDPTNLGRGRLIPTTSWDALWHGVAQWFGIDTPEEIQHVLPNNGNFGCRLYTDSDLYHDGTNSITGCGGPTMNFDMGMFIAEPRYLTGIEQKRICEAAIALVSDATDLASRCVIIDQKIVVNFEEKEYKNFEYDEEESNLRRLRVLQEGVSNSTNNTFELNIVMEINVANSTNNSTNNNSTNTTTTVNVSPGLVGNAIADNLLSIVNIANVTNVSSVTPYTPEPSPTPSLQPSMSSFPSTSPSSVPSDAPSDFPSDNPSVSQQPSISAVPSSQPSDVPSVSSQPSDLPSLSLSPSDMPSNVPSVSTLPSDAPSMVPSNVPSDEPSFQPSDYPSGAPSSQPSISVVPSNAPSDQPSGQPTSNCAESPEPDGGCVWGLFYTTTCECYCIQGVCKDQFGRCAVGCTSTENPFEDCTIGFNCPWFVGGLRRLSQVERGMQSSFVCETGPNVPAGIYDIYKNPEECCSVNYPSSSDCVAQSLASISGGGGSSGDKYYPDFTGSGTCVNDGNAPSWMSNPGYPEYYLFSSSASCCQKWYPLDDTCDDGSAPTSTNTTGQYYPDLYGSQTCKADGNAPAWMSQPGYGSYYLFDSSASCCNRWYPQKSDCEDGSTPSLPSNVTDTRYYPVVRC